MAQVNYINANEFMQMLRENNLVIVRQEELEANNEIKRQQLLKRKHLSLTEIVKAKFFPIKSTKALIDWCEKGKFGKDGFYQMKNKQYRILTSAIKRELYGNDLIDTTDQIKNIEVVGVEVVKECKGFCAPENYFEQIEMCRLCGKLI